MTTNATRFSIAAAVLATVVTLTGCSAAAPKASSTPTPSASASASASASVSAPASQTHAEACAVVTNGFTSVAKLQGEAASVMNDPSKAAALLKKVDVAVQSIDQKVGNVDVKKVTSSAATAIHDYAAYIDKAISDPTSIDVTAVKSKAEALAAKFQAVQAECA